MEERQPHFERPTTNRPPSLVNLGLLTVTIAVIGGALGFWAMQALSWNNTSLNPLGEFNRNITVNLEQPLTDLARKYEQSVAGVYTAKAILPKLKQVTFTADDYLGAATVVTSDGWLMSTDQVVKTGKEMIVLNDKIYPIKEIKSDEFSNLVFVKIEANFLQPIDFQLTSKLAVAETVFTNFDVPQAIEHAFYRDYLAHEHYQIDQYLSTDKVDYYLRLGDQAESANLAATPFFNVKGDVLGVFYQVKQDKLLIPAEYLKQAVKILLSQTSRPSLGLYYFDFENQAGFNQKGHLLYHSQLSAVTPNSLAAKAGLKVGDQVIAVNNEVITAERSLTSIIQSYRSGDKILLKISRNELEQEIEVQL